MANLRVLLADSNSSFRTTAQRALTRQGYLVIPASDGEDALALLGDDEIDIVVADVELPTKSGLVLLEAAKSKSATTPVILLAEPSAVDEAVTGVREGASAYLVKPIDDLDRLLELVEKAAGKAPSTPSGLAEQVIPKDSSIDQLPNVMLLNATVSGQDLNQLLSLYARELAQIALSPQSIVLLAHSDGQLHIAAAHGFGDRAEAGRAFVQAGGEEFAYSVAATHDLVERPGPAAEKGEGSSPLRMVGLPLLFGNEALGVSVVFANASAGNWEESAFEKMRTLTRQASLAVELARVRGLADSRNPTDKVTGLLNREHFFELADREFRRSWRFAERIAGVQLDVDEFARLNLMLGADETDEIMKQVARSVHVHVRNIDIVGRLDADKLGLLLLNATRESAMGIAERLRRSVAEIELNTRDGTWQVTASVGVAAYPREQCASIHDLFGLAAQAARAAIRAGHNRVVSV